MKLYKLTTPAGKSGTPHAPLQWGENITHTLPAVDSPKLCSPDVIHVYRSPHLGLLLNPIHGDCQDPVVWEGEGKVVVEDWDKAGCFEFTTTRKVDLAVTPRIYLRFAILCARAVLPIYELYRPADIRPRLAIKLAEEVGDCLARKDTGTAEAAAKAEKAAKAAAEAAAWAAWAAKAAAEAAAWAAWAAKAVNGLLSNPATHSINFPSAEAEGAAWAAEAAAEAAKAAKAAVDFVALAEESWREEEER